MSGSDAMALRVRQRQLVRSREAQMVAKNLPQNISETERWISLGAGGLLLLSGLTGFNARGLILGLFGAGLIHRGLTGHCCAYEALGMDTSEHNASTAVLGEQA